MFPTATAASLQSTLEKILPVQPVLGRGRGRVWLIDRYWRTDDDAREEFTRNKEIGSTLGTSSVRCRGAARRSTANMDDECLCKADCIIFRIYGTVANVYAVS